MNFEMFILPKKKNLICQKIQCIRSTAHGRDFDAKHTVA